MAEGERAKEGTLINLSLSALGQVTGIVHCYASSLLLFLYYTKLLHIIFYL